MKRATVDPIPVAVEMTGDYGLVLPLMIANMSAFALSRHWRRTQVYEALLAQDGIVLPHDTRPLDPPGDAELPAPDLPPETKLWSALQN